MKKVFLIGSIGSGKSTALALLRSKGAAVLSADSVVHDLYQNDVALIQQIDKRFGPGLVKGGHIDRKRLAIHLLEHPEDIYQLEDMVHPKVQKIFLQTIQQASNPVFVYELPISRSTTDFALADAIILVQSSKELRLNRIMQRAMNEEEARQRVELHPEPFIPENIPLFTIVNDGDEASFAARVSDVWNEILND